MNFKSLIITVLGLILFISCKKNEVTENPTAEPDLPDYAIKSATHTASAVTYKYVYALNAKAQTTERQYFFPATATTSSSIVTYSYNDEGKLAATSSTSTGNANTIGEEYIYDSQGRLVTRKTFLNGNPSGTSTYTYNGNTVIEDYAGLVTYTATLDNSGNVIKKIAEFINDPSQNYIEEWLDYDDKPIINEAPPSAGSLQSKNNFHKSKLTFTDWNKQAYNKTYDYQYTFNTDGYVIESKQYDYVTGALVSTIVYELIKP
jgi:hypothetical protein